jgi:hypothetical protein
VSSPSALLVQLAGGYRVARTPYVLAEIGVPDVLALFDLATVIDRAVPSGRLSLQLGDFFRDTLPACECLLSNIHYDWNDREVDSGPRADLKPMWGCWRGRGAARNSKQGLDRGEGANDQARP